MSNQIVKAAPVIYLLVLLGVISDVFFLHGLNLWWLWIGVTVITGLTHYKYADEQQKEGVKEIERWDREQKALEKTFSDLETSYHSLRVPSSVHQQLKDLDKRSNIG